MDMNNTEQNKITDQESSALNHSRQSTASPEEAAERAAQLRTQGRKGCKAVRINMAFTPENHDYIKIMARCSGVSMTEFINIIIEQYRNEHKELFEQAKDVLEQINFLANQE